MRSAKAPVPAWLVGASLVVALAGCDDGEPVKSPEPTAAPTPGVGLMVTIAGDGTGMGWDSTKPAAGQAAGSVGPVVALPDGGLLATTTVPPQVVRLDAEGGLHNIGLGYRVGRILATGIGSDRVGLLADDTSFITVRPADGTTKILARFTARTIEPGTPSPGSVLRRGGVWWVQRGSEVLAVSDAGKVSPVTLPVAPSVLATDQGDLLIATKDEVIRLAGSEVSARMSLRGLDLQDGYSPAAMVGDGKGGAYVAMEGQAAVVHAMPGADPKLLVRGKAGITRCGEVPIGDLMAAPLLKIEGLAMRRNDLVIADYECQKIYQYGLPK